MSSKQEMNPVLKFALDLGPLILFFAANAKWGIFAGTGAFMVATVIALIVTYALTRRIAVMPLVSAGVVMVFGGLTLALQNETFIKLKPTIVYLLFAAVLVGGLLLRRPLLAMVFDSVFNLTDEGWRKLTVRWAVFFFAMAALNEIVWRTQSTDFWVSFKVFGAVPLTFVFAALQYPLLMKYTAETPGTAGKDA